ncbi:MAG: polysaccharide deacetylase family protein, partial [Patescibacteria group bacterium]|nr:polysaccharide deacetylase family protein [Patescibacteria group bacterium]
YIVPGFIGTNTDSLTPSEMQDVVNSGLIDIGAHTMHHISLKGKPLATVAYEVNQSKTVLENTYHINVYAFAYPYGTFDKQAISVVKQAGFTTAASTIAGNEQNNQNRFILFRVRPGYLTGQALLNYLNYRWPSYKYDSGE